MKLPNRAKTKARETGQRLIYVVDDEPLLLELAAAVLEPLGYEIKTFRDPETALRSFASAERRPTLVITDYAMHPMSGLELIAGCRRLEPQQKTLLLSGTVDEEIYGNVPAKPDRFLAKPYQGKQLIEALKSLVTD